MMIYIQGTDYTVWKIIKNGPNIPFKIVDTKKVPKTKDEQNENDIKSIQANAKAKHIIYRALDPNEFNRIFACDTAKKIWD